MTLNWNIEVLITFIGFLFFLIFIFILVRLIYIKKSKIFLFPLITFSIFAAFHLFETLAYLFLSFELKRLGQMCASFGLLSLILNVDLISKERVSYFKFVAASVFIGIILVLIFIPENIQQYTHALGGYETLGIKGSLRILNIFILFLLCFELTLWFYKTWQRAPDELRKDALGLFITSLLFYIFTLLLFLLGIWLIFPIGYLLTGASVAIVAFFVYRQPKLLYILSFKGQRITVVTNESGIPLFDLSWQMKGDRILPEQKGFVKWVPVLQQVSQKIAGYSTVREMKLENSTILFKQGNYITTVLLSSRNSPILGESIEKYTKAFEHRYGKILKIGMNDSNYYGDATELINEFFPLGTMSTLKASESLESYLDELVKQRTSELEQINTRLQEADRLKSLFLASMSHELRTPLASILGYTEIMMLGYSGEINNDQQQQLGSVYNSAQHLLNLINGILDISKIEAGKFKIYPEEFNFNELLEEVMEALTPKISQKSLELETDLTANIEMKSDEGRLKQILFNIIGNAVKFTPPGGKISIKAKIVDKEYLKVHVVDTGIGISKTGINQLFKPFQQVDTSIEKSMEGTGLGLYLSKKLVNLLGGEIFVQSELGKGSDFNFRLPLQVNGKI
ncbi:MAG: sensor histidine kinase [Candidatus Hermodarchaeota archaeon]